MNYSISVPFSAIQTALNYGANVTSTSTSVVLPDGSTVTSSYGVTPPIIDYSYNQANIAYDQANTAASIAAAAFYYANTISGGPYADNVARVSAQSAWVLANTAVTYIKSNNAYFQTAYNTANANISLLQAYSNQANANISILYGIETSQNANIISLQSYSNQANANIIFTQGVDLAQNTFIQSAYTQANTATKYVSSATAPSSPRVNDMWYDTDNDVLLRYTDDGTSNNWIDITGPIFKSTFIRPTYLISANVS